MHCFHDHCRGILDAINRELRSRIGKTEYQRTEVTSLASPGVDDYPKPPDEAAFYGLAGDIVRRILPQTEADPVALLFQLLVAFGNIIGHTAYTVADGARHYCNIFGVLVGETSKGRKGTAWQNILNIIQHLDEQWCNNCITHGLSSGEGLIQIRRSQTPRAPRPDSTSRPWPAIPAGRANGPRARRRIPS